jgi:hypothetical protein
MIRSVNSLSISDFLTGSMAGVILWVAYTLSRELKNYSWNDKPFGLIVIDSVYDLLCSAVVGGIIAIWN